MPQVHDPLPFLELQIRELPAFDVRTPSEFLHGHIPDAINFPLFSDKERADVGTVYAREGRQAAVLRGLELAGGQLAAKLRRACELAGDNREILMYCWRGGMRSASMAWLLETGGFTVHILRGGYKAYRTHVRHGLARGGPVHVLGGMTGSGKTDILLAMRAAGAQVIDLEGLACHRGSLFGGVGMAAQPFSEMVENRLHRIWSAMDFSRPVWVEDESRRIGSVTLCDEFFHHIETGRLVTVEIPDEARVQRLVNMYSHARAGEGSSPDRSAVSENPGRTPGEFDADLIRSIELLKKRLGGECCRYCINAVTAGDYASAARALLRYYDKAYLHGLNRRRDQIGANFALPGDDPPATAALLLQHFPA